MEAKQQQEKALVEGKGVPTPEATIAVTIKGEKKDVKMTSGLRAQLVAHIDNIDMVGQTYVDPIMQQVLIVTCLRDRTPAGTAKEVPGDIDLDFYDLSLEDTDRLVDWICRHAIAFFINGAVTFKNNSEEPLKVLQSLARSLTGSLPSPETKPSAGDTIAA